MEITGSKEIDLKKAVVVACQTAVEAGKILQVYFPNGENSGLQVTQKGIDLTTEADRETEAFIKQRLTMAIPGTQFLGEEMAGTNQDYSFLSDAENIWIVDPLDGTINFSRGHTNFAVSIALADKGQIKLGAIYLPMAGKLFWTTNDPNDTVHLNDDSTSKVSATSELNHALVAIDWPYKPESRRQVLSWANMFAPYVRQIKSTGSAVSDLALVATGKIDGYVQLDVKPWDIAAGALLVQKAGGVVTTPDGDEWDITNPRILATNNVLHDQLLNLVRQGNR